jgi:S1/P1 Nuclease
MVASNRSAQACIVDKIEPFAAELADPRTDPEERLVALKFVLHLVGDLHQPLHAADDHDAGGNRKRVVAEGFRPGNLHHFWGRGIRRTPRHRSPAGRRSDRLESPTTSGGHGRRGTVSDWTTEAFDLARRDAYGRLPGPTANGVYVLDASYVDAAEKDCPNSGWQGWCSARSGTRSGLGSKR